MDRAGRDSSPGLASRPDPVNVRQKPALRTAPVAVDGDRGEGISHNDGDRQDLSQVAWIDTVSRGPGGAQIDRPILDAQAARLRPDRRPFLAGPRRTTPRADAW